MIQDIIFIILGLVTLYLGGDGLVTAASRLAASFGISPLIIGLTIVAFGTSTPELIVNLSAALQGSNDLALGNVVGSNIANIGLILGVAGMIAPIAVAAHLVRREIPMVMGISALLLVLALDEDISRVDGVILVVGLVLFNLVFLYLASREQDDQALPDFQAKDAEAIQTPREVLRLLFGLGLLILGGQLMVEGATNIAKELGVSDLLIGLTLVAFGTSLPELSASIIAAMKNETDILVGNIIGSNIYNILAVLGITAVIEPIPVTEAALQQQFPVMLLYSFMLLPFALDRTFTRFESGIFLGGYVAFVVFSFIAA